MPHRPQRQRPQMQRPAHAAPQWWKPPPRGPPMHQPHMGLPPRGPPLGGPPMQQLGAFVPAGLMGLRPRGSIRQRQGFQGPQPPMRPPPGGFLQVLWGFHLLHPCIMAHKCRLLLSFIARGMSCACIGDLHQVVQQCLSRASMALIYHEPPPMSLLHVHLAFICCLLALQCMICELLQLCMARGMFFSHIDYCHPMPQQTFCALHLFTRPPLSGLLQVHWACPLLPSCIAAHDCRQTSVWMPVSFYGKPMVCAAQVLTKISNWAFHAVTITI